MEQFTFANSEATSSRVSILRHSSFSNILSQIRRPDREDWQLRQTTPSTTQITLAGTWGIFIQLRTSLKSGPHPAVLARTPTELQSLQMAPCGIASQVCHPTRLCGSIQKTSNLPRRLFPREEVSSAIWLPRKKERCISPVAASTKSPLLRFIKTFQPDYLIETWYSGWSQ